MQGQHSTLDNGGTKVDFNQLVPVDLNKKKLGSGAYASVKLVKDPSTGRLFALKEVKRISYP